MNGNTVRSLDDNDVSRQKVITAMSRKLKENGHQNGEKPDLANSLVLMGFTDRQVNCQALKATNNVLKDAVAWLIERNRVSIAKLESEKKQEQELKRQTLPVVDSSNHVFGARSSGMDYFATSKSPSMALLPKWLLDRLPALDVSQTESTLCCVLVALRLRRIVRRMRHNRSIIITVSMG